VSIVSDDRRVYLADSSAYDNGDTNQRTWAVPLAVDHRCFVLELPCVCFMWARERQRLVANDLRRHVVHTMRRRFMRVDAYDMFEDLDRRVRSVSRSAARDRGAWSCSPPASCREKSPGAGGRG
jgi:hypothetical protein